LDATTIGGGDRNASLDARVEQDQVAFTIADQVEE